MHTSYTYTYMYISSSHSYMYTHLYIYTYKYMYIHVLVVDAHEGCVQRNRDAKYVYTHGDRHTHTSMTTHTPHPLYPDRGWDGGGRTLLVSCVWLSLSMQLAVHYSLSHSNLG